MTYHNKDDVLYVLQFSDIELVAHFYSPLLGALTDCSLLPEAVLLVGDRDACKKLGTDILDMFQKKSYGIDTVYACRLHTTFKLISGFRPLTSHRHINVSTASISPLEFIWGL